MENKFKDNSTDSFGCQSVSKQTIEELVSISQQVRVELTIGGSKVDAGMLKKIFALFP